MKNDEKKTLPTITHSVVLVREIANGKAFDPAVVSVLNQAGLWDIPKAAVWCLSPEDLVSWFVPDIVKPSQTENEEAGERIPVPDNHIGRTWSCTRIEDDCPCEQEACGLISITRIDPNCYQHGMIHRAQTMRQGHPANRCPGVREGN